MKSMKAVLVAAFQNAIRLRKRKPAVAAKAAKKTNKKDIGVSFSLALHFDFVSETLREHSLVFNKKK